MCRWSLFLAWVVPRAAGCAGPAAPVLRSGDVVRPEVTFAPREPWPAGAKVAIGMLLRVDQSAGESRYLRDEEVDPSQSTMHARVTFLDGDRSLGDPLEVPFVRDC